ncbi:MAG: DUF3575 domain-containing protein [Bacteroidales bacterium]|nr:DUF3575 domain-containing protein [Bacteroidales bacterium]
MKNTILLFALMFSIVSVTSAQQQNENNTSNNYSNTVKFSTLPFVNSTFQLSYERFLKKDKSLALFAGYTYRDNWRDEREGFNFEMQYKYFVFESKGRKTVKKLYFAPYVSFYYTDFTDEEYYWYNNDPEEDYYSTVNYIIKSYRGGVLVGFNWILAERITLDIYLGGGIRKTNNFNKNSDTNYNRSVWEPGYNGIAPKIGMDVGINF